MNEPDEKTPWWMWPLLPIWLLVQLVGFLFVVAFGIWRLLLYLTIPLVVIAVIVVLITGGGGDSTSTSSASTLGPDQRYNEEAVAVLNKYQLYLRSLPQATPQNLDEVTPKQVLAEKTAVADFSQLVPPADLHATQKKLLSEMETEVRLSEETLQAFDRREPKKLERLLSELSSGLVKYNRLGTEIYEAAEAERG